jgi:hypothetical protein
MAGRQKSKRLLVFGFRGAKPAETGSPMFFGVFQDRTTSFGLLAMRLFFAK